VKMEPNKRAGDALEGSAAKRQRTGVGSSVASLVRTEADDFVLLLTKIRVEQLRPKGSRIVGIIIHHLLNLLSSGTTRGYRP
jgi:hypothetical protein